MSVGSDDGPNIVLTGFMGTGKTAVGEQLSQLTGREFVDTDAEIVLRHGAIETIFDRDGEAHFRQLERDVISSLAPRRNLVIATGGGTLLDPDNVLALMGNEIFTLTADPAEIVHRVTRDGVGTRPLLANSDDPAETIRELLAERQESYGRFPAVDTTGKSIDEVIDSLREAGATIESPEELEAEAASERSSADTAITVVIAMTVAVLIVLIVLVLSF